MKVTNFSKSTNLPSLPGNIDGHEFEAYKSEHGIVLTAPTHPKQVTIILLRGEQPIQVHGRMKRLVLDLAKGREEAESALGLKKDDFASWFFGMQSD